VNVQRQPSLKLVLGVLGVVLAAVLIVAGIFVALVRAGVFGGSGTTGNTTCSELQTTPPAVPDPGGQFNVVQFYGPIAQYAKDAQGKSLDERQRLWDVDVLTTNLQMHEMFSGGQFADWKTTLAQADPVAFRCVALDMQRSHYEQQTLSALQKDAKVLPGPQANVFILPWDTTNHTGGTSDVGAIFIPFWEPADPLDRSQHTTPINWSDPYWARVFFAPLDHEYYEVARYHHVGDDTGPAYNTLIDYMVTDGAADAFAHAMLGDLYTGHDTLLTPEQEASIWGQVKSKLNTPGQSDYGNAVMLGDASQGFPNATGYCIGYHIVERYLKNHPGVTWDQFAKLDGATVLAGSGYDGVR
jgi:hypothetical protein